MATAVVMPRQGNTVERCLIAAWKKEKGDTVTAGDILCEIETDKAMMEVEAPASGMVLDLFFQAGEEVPVLTTIAVIGRPGEDVTPFRPNGTADHDESETAPTTSPNPPILATGSGGSTAPTPRLKISPRARRLADTAGLDLTGVQGSGPGGRVMERDVQAVLTARVIDRPAQTASQAPPLHPTSVPTGAPVDEVEIAPVKGMRKLIADRMLASLQTTAQLTLHASADARRLQAYRQRLKQSAAGLGLQPMTVTDLVLFGVSRLLRQHPQLNALFSGNTLAQYKNVHLAVAVDTPRGLMVPVIRNAHTLSLSQIAAESKRLAAACRDGTIAPVDLNGGTFTVSNLGGLGVESFTPVLNPPQVAVLGVCNINLKPVERDGGVEFVPQLGLSLTFNHQVVDGAPAARFLQTVCQGLADFELLLAL
ncbi:MAG: 2-oxo acid dehydrogenase subunit E2 [Anaerolineaceae bacterium]|nr:2-oxo acid dehydrogenase subunit E2 [Anaerolineaceae bacterium]MCB9102026.1 2-oxo acid dehydrogenase subunit E2 [Anaerolineales bacterium]